MPGGLLNLISEGNINSILTGNPKKTFFSTTYSKYTNFGMQKLRLDFEGLRTLRMTEDSVFSFNVPRHADLLMDTYFVVTLPNIWSPIRYVNLGKPMILELNDTDNQLNIELSGVSINFLDNLKTCFWPFEFKWIENLGSQMIRSVKYSVGGTVIQEFTGQYLYNMVNRDFSKAKRELFDEMTGNTKELNDPANYGGRNNNYPNVIYHQDWENPSDTTKLGPEPSIRGRKIYVPLNIWSTLNSKLAFPLVSLQYETLNIEVICRPIQELFVVKYQPSPRSIIKFNELEQKLFRRNNLHDGSINEIDFENIKNIGNYVQPNQVNNYYQMYRFLSPPQQSPLPLSFINSVPTRLDGTRYWFFFELDISYHLITDEQSRNDNSNVDIIYLFETKIEEESLNGFNIEFVRDRSNTRLDLFDSNTVIHFAVIIKEPYRRSLLVIQKLSEIINPNLDISSSISLHHMDLILKLTFTTKNIFVLTMPLSLEQPTKLDNSFVDNISTLGYRDLIRGVQLFSALEPYNVQIDLSSNGGINIDIEETNYVNKDTNWNSDIHLIANYVFLGDEERQQFARQEQHYLVKEIHETTFFNKTGNNLINLNSQGLISSWMWYFQRSDVNLRNEWSNYSNWDYNTIPYKGITNLIHKYKENYIPSLYYNQANNFINSGELASWYSTGLNNFGFFWIDDTSATNLTIDNSGLPFPFLITGPLHVENQYEIMTNWGLLLNGKYRETNMDSGIVNYVEKYIRTAGNAKSGLYCYNFTLNTDPFVYQPSGAINLSKFNLIQFETSTILPPHREDVNIRNIKDSCGNVIGISKPTWSLFSYNYNLHIMEERYNILKFTGGMASLVFSR